MEKRKRTTLLYILLVLIGRANSLLLEGANVCSKIETYFDKVYVSVNEPSVVEEEDWCFNIPPRCRKQKTVVKPVKKSHNLVKTRIVSKCCEGYVESRDGKNCIPSCPDGCFFGSCEAPNTCKCASHFEGASCDKIKQTVLMKELKMCPTGFYGMNCNTTCPDYKYGQNCALNCSCQNSSGCNSITGECICLPGWMDSHCMTPCPVGKYGLQCLQDCHCSTKGNCRNTDGFCECKSDWTGKYCEMYCPLGLDEDPNCEQRCNCEEQSCNCGNNTATQDSAFVAFHESHFYVMLLSIGMVLIFSILIFIILIIQRRIFGSKRKRNSGSESSCNSENQLLPYEYTNVQKCPESLLSNNLLIVASQAFTNKSYGLKNNITPAAAVKANKYQTIYVSPDTQSIHLYEEIKDKNPKLLVYNTLNHFRE